MTDQQPVDTQTRKEVLESDYFVRPIEQKPGVAILTDAFVQADPQDKGPWAAGANVFLPKDTPVDSIVVVVSRTEKGEVTKQYLKVGKMKEGKLMGEHAGKLTVQRVTDDRVAQSIVEEDFDMFKRPENDPLYLAAMRRLRPGNPVDADNRQASHVQLIDSSGLKPTSPKVDMLFGLITPADKLRYKNHVQQRLNESVAATSKVNATPVPAR